MAEKTCGAVDRIKRGAQCHSRAMQPRVVLVGVEGGHQKSWAKGSRGVRGTSRGGVLPFDPKPLVLQPTFHHQEHKRKFPQMTK